MFRTAKQLADHELRLATLALAVAELRKERDASMPHATLKLIEQLQQDIDALRISLRSLHGKVAYEKRGQTPAGGRADAGTNDEEFQAMLDLQKAFGGGG